MIEIDPNDPENPVARSFDNQAFRIGETVEAHTRLLGFLSSSKVVIMNSSLQSLESFKYLSEFLVNNQGAITEIVFRNIKQFRKETFSQLRQPIKKLSGLKKLVFEHTYLPFQHIEIILDIISAQRDTLIQLNFIQCGLNDMDLEYLFFSTIFLENLSALREIRLEQNPLLFGSPHVLRINEHIKTNK